MTSWAKRDDKRTLTGRPWRRLREQILRRDRYLCQCPDCQGGIKRVREANEVDHIVPVSQDGDDSPSNLRAVNAECHKRLTTAQNRGKRRVAIGVDGWPVEG